MNLKNDLTINPRSSNRATANNVNNANKINLNDMFLQANSISKISNKPKANNNFGTLDAPNSLVQKPRIMRGNNENKLSHTKLSVNSNFINKPSDKFIKKSSDPFESGNKKRSNFVYVYQAGGIPCRIIHGSVRLKLNWEIPPESIN